ncbi:hypothetical protein BDV12DRAFT_191819 [Aspergillus spectabilis]
MSTALPRQEIGSPYLRLNIPLALYAILLFEGISIPTKARDSVPAHEFLDLGLETLQALNKLVQNYCTILGPHLLYASLLNACSTVVCWGGYIRDIGAALTSSHRCKLPRASPPTESNRTAEAMSLEGMERTMYEVATGSPSRSTIDRYPDSNNLVKELVSSAAPPSQISDAASAAVSAIGEFNHKFRDFMNHCMENPEHLSTGSKVSSVSIILFWNLGALILVESLLSKPTINIPSHLSSTIHSLQKESIFSITQISQRLLSLAPEEPFNLQNGLAADVPILAYHITPSLTATTFKKAIEAIVSEQGPSPHNRKENQQPTTNDNDIRKHQIDSSMKAISSLDVTVGGAQASRTAFDGLMRRYGDVLSECWSESFET